MHRYIQRNKLQPYCIYLIVLFCFCIWPIASRNECGQDLSYLPEFHGTTPVHLRRRNRQLPGGHDPGVHKNQGELPSPSDPDFHVNLDLIRVFKPRRNDNLPEKVCLSCLSEISNCYIFKIKCENSSRTLRQLLPNALPEEPDSKVSISCPVATTDQAVQTTSWEPDRCTASVQTDAVTTTDAEQNTSLIKSTISVDLDYEGEGEVFDYELPDEPVEKTTSLILQVQGNLKDEKEVVFTQTNVIYEGDDHELEQQIRECNLAIFEGVDNEAEIITVTAPQVTTRKSAAKLLTQQENDKHQTPVGSKEEARELEKEQVPQSAKRTSRRRGVVKLDVPATPSHVSRVRSVISQSITSLLW